MDEIPGIDIIEFENNIKNDNNLSADIKFGVMVLIKRYKLLIDCNINEYKILCNCMGGTTKLLDNIENNFRFEELSIEDNKVD
jgi:hypothetical protein